MPSIPLSKGRVALVDDADYPALAAYRWSYGARGYAVRHLPKAQDPQRSTVLMHRVILGAANGTHIDHANGDRLDNRRANLRPATRSQNGRNRGPQPKADRTSPYKGVYWSGEAQRWRAQIVGTPGAKHLGYFPTEDDAARAYDAAAREHFGEFAWLNFPREVTNVR